jgi:hypothetical protein
MFSVESVVAYELLFFGGLISRYFCLRTSNAVLKIVKYIVEANPGVYCVGLQPFDCWDRRFESG